MVFLCVGWFFFLVCFVFCFFFSLFVWFGLFLNPELFPTYTWCSIPDTAQKLGENTLTEMTEEETTGSTHALLQKQVRAATSLY